MTADLTKDEDKFHDGFTSKFFSVNGELEVSEQQRQDAIALCKQADKKAALACMSAFGSTDFREDLPKVTVPVLVLHGDGDATVPFEGSGQRTHAALPGRELRVIAGAPTAATSATPMNGTKPSSSSCPNKHAANADALLLLPLQNPAQDEKISDSPSPGHQSDGQGRRTRCSARQTTAPLLGMSSVRTKDL